MGKENLFGASITHKLVLKITRLNCAFQSSQVCTGRANKRTTAKPNALRPTPSTVRLIQAVSNLAAVPPQDRADASKTVIRT